ncbi:MAG: hypothetical protein WAV20_05340 [Blastocatellia bacterium]
MISTGRETPRRHERLLKPSATLVALIIISANIAVPARAQTTFNSGSTGADGAFAPTASQEVQIPESGFFNFTTVNIPRGVTITFRRNSKNTPVTLLATGNVTIAGTVDVSGRDGQQSSFDGGRASGAGLGGPGGFNGGGGGFSFSPFFAATSGDGPGAGSVTFRAGGGAGFAAPGGDNHCTFGLDLGGPSYGSRLLVPLIGGSGGGGTSGSSGVPGAGGGGGGGAVLIASSGNITFGPDLSNKGSILATGGSVLAGQGGGGSGGAIRLIANTITGAALLDVTGGGGGQCGNNGGHGYMRVEAFSFTGFQPEARPQNTFDNKAMISLGQPNPVTMPNAPRLRIASVAGIAAPANAAGSFGGPADIVVPTAQPNPVNVAIEAANIPVGTVVKLRALGDASGSATVDSTPLEGAGSASTASASVSLGGGVTIITATVSLTPSTTAANRMIDGERVDRIEVAATYGGGSNLTYIMQSGRRISSIQR